MILSDVSVKRPVFATVISLVLVVFGALSFMQLPLREYPDTSPPIVSISTSYPGASAEIVETQITQLIEDQINGIEGVNSINSRSRDGSSNISVEFSVGRDIDQAANDIRDKISRVTRRLPDEVDPPQIAKADSDSRPIQNYSLTSTQMTFLELNDYANRFLVDQFAVVDGVASVQLRGNGGFAMRVWLDRIALTARGLTVVDVESALRRQNLELPAGRVDSTDREFTVRVERVYQTADDFARLVISRGDDGHLVTLGEVARVEIGSANDRSSNMGNGVESVGIGIVKQSTANTLTVVQGTTALAERIRTTLPDHMDLISSSSDGAFIESSIASVYETIFVTMVLVSLVIYMFMGSFRIMLIPVVTIPVCLMAAFMVLAMFGMSINLITLLGLVLCIGLIVDDSIVVLENIQRRVEGGEAPLLAAFNGARQVAFPVLATTAVIVAVFVPVVFMEGSLGIIFYQLAITIGGAIVFSSLLALTLTPMMCSKLLHNNAHDSFVTRGVNHVFRWLQRSYRQGLVKCLEHARWVFVALALIGGCIYFLVQNIPSTFAPTEDQGVFMVRMDGPEGASLEYMKERVALLEAEALPYLESGEVENMIFQVPGFGGGNSVNSAMAIISLPEWRERPRPTEEIMNEMVAKWSQYPGLEVNTFMRSGLVRGGGGNPVQFVLGGREYDEIARWRDLVTQRAEASGLFGRLQSDYDETKPSLDITVNKIRAADLGVSIQTIGRTLQAMMNESRVTTFQDRGEEYDVILQAEDSQRASPSDLTNIYVRSETSGQLIPLANLITVQNSAGPAELSRYNRVRAITISGNLTPGVSLDEALSFLENVVVEELPEYAQIDYKGESLELKESSGGIVLIFGMALVVVFLVLAAQFESFIHPVVIMTTVPLAIFGALLGLFLTDGSLNIYSNIGLIVLVGISAKNGILIVEFANQMRDEGMEFVDALVEACDMRLRPVMMTALATTMGAVPLILSVGAGSESRILLGVVIFSGVCVSTILTLFVVPLLYKLLARNTGSPEAVANMLKKLQEGMQAEKIDSIEAQGAGEGAKA